MVYVTDRAHRPFVYPIISERFGELKPCSTGLIVAGLALWRRAPFVVVILLASAATAIARLIG